MDRTRAGSHDMRAAWEQHATAWIRWAREPGHDSYWRFHRDAFLEIMPPPGRLTLDLGCGEGRLSRDLRTLGHSVVGVDSSPTMVEAARASDPEIDVRLGDAAALPFADDEFDCVAAFMSLQDVDDLRGAVREAARVLEPQGTICVAIVHPLNSAGEFESEACDSRFVIAGSYLEESAYVDEIERDGHAFTFVSAHRPIEAYTEALFEAGFVIDRLRESALPASAALTEPAHRWLRVPLFLHLRAAKQG